MSEPTDSTLTRVATRDKGRCALCGLSITGTRGFDWSLHHRRPRGAGGTSLAWVNLPGNLVLLHGSGTTSCHGRVEKNRKTHLESGLLVSGLGVAISADVPIWHAVHGHVLLDDIGGFAAVAA